PRPGRTTRVPTSAAAPGPVCPRDDGLRARPAPGTPPPQPPFPAQDTLPKANQACPLLYRPAEPLATRSRAPAGRVQPASGVDAGNLSGAPGTRSVDRRGPYVVIAWASNRSA